MDGVDWETRENRWPVRSSGGAGASHRHGGNHRGHGVRTGNAGDPHKQGNSLDAYLIAGVIGPGIGEFGQGDLRRQQTEESRRVFVWRGGLVVADGVPGSSLV